MMYYWTASGMDAAGKKMEHVTPDPRPGQTGFIQGSTAGYFGHYYMNDLDDLLESASGLPDMIDGEYYVYQGELDIWSQIKLGLKGQYAGGRAANVNYAGGEDDITETVTFEDIDGLEVFLANDGNLYAMIQEDSGSTFGERMLITSPLEHVDDGKELTYYFVAMSGGRENTRMKAGVGIPAGTNGGAGSHEFSGLFDLSGLLRHKDHAFTLAASDDGWKKCQQDARVHINDKYILVGLQASNFNSGAIGTFGADRGGQWLCYQPNIPV